MTTGTIRIERLLTTFGLGSRIGTLPCTSLGGRCRNAARQYEERQREQRLRTHDRDFNTDVPRAGDLRLFNVQSKTIMKKKVGMVALAVLLITGMISAAGDVQENTSEFYFTRLAYSENGTRGFGRFVPKNFRCPEFGGGNFFPPQGLGWSMDSPGADCKYMGGIHRLTGLSVYTNPNMIRITDPDLFRYPYAYIVEPGGLDLTDKEVLILREYLNRGGFIHADDF